MPGGWECVRQQLSEPELPRAEEGCGLLASDGAVNGCFLPLLVPWVQPCEEQHIPLLPVPP